MSGLPAICVDFSTWSHTYESTCSCQAFFGLLAVGIIHGTGSSLAGAFFCWKVSRPLDREMDHVGVFGL